MEPRRALSGWLIAAVLAVYLHVFLEWLFFVTKPSFMEALAASERVGVLLISPLPPIALLAGVTALFWLLQRAVPAPGIPAVARGVPAAILACWAFILIDNFTYNVFGWGVVSTAGVVRFAHLALVLGLFAWLYRALAPAATPARASAVLAGGLVVVSLIGALWQLAVSASPPVLAAEGVPAARQLPNIFILGGDGVEAAHTSVYGYQRDTTLFLARLMGRGLVYENAFPNANSSAGSLTALLTGKRPLRTRVLQYPDILTGVNAYQHLPGILKRLGYHSIHVSQHLYTDPFALNMLDSFDVSNFRERRGALRLPALPPRLALAYAPALHFLGELHGRVAERVLHAAAIRSMANPLVDIETGRGRSDEARIGAVLDFFDRATGPVFAHLHLMGTHGPFFPRRPVFSAGVTDESRALRGTDLYDDTIADFDRDVARIAEHLERTGELANTVLVVISDHGWKWSYSRVPLMFVFPGHAPRGRVPANAQLMDVAPTLLHYLGVPVPEWMDGTSLLDGNLDPKRPLITVQVYRKAAEPFLRVGKIGLTICDRVFWLDPHAGTLSDVALPGHTGPCSSSPDGGAQTRATLIHELRVNGYDVSSLEGGPQAR